MELREDAALRSLNAYESLLTRAQRNIPAIRGRVDSRLSVQWQLRYCIKFRKAASRRVVSTRSGDSSPEEEEANNSICSEESREFLVLYSRLLVRTSELTLARVVREVCARSLHMLLMSTELSAESPTLAPTALDCGSALSLTLVVRSLSGERA